MSMSPGMRRLALTAHITTSVGWLGAVAVFLVLAVVGLRADDSQTMRGIYIALDLTGWRVIVPLSLATLATGLIQSLGTAWGLFRHYWVIVKLVIAVLATFVLLLHMGPVSYLARAAANGLFTTTDLLSLRMQLVVDAAAAVLVLLVATALSVYKPRGVTPYGWRKLR
ncbi:MAG: hypothetical protein HOQ30_07790 [Gemmatimonadaceae bacterium]|nr:hypothetical protein [Gemmatimonadaceae bacterium]